MDKVAVRAPVAEGVKVRMMVQEPLAAIEPPLAQVPPASREVRRIAACEGKERCGEDFRRRASVGDSYRQRGAGGALQLISEGSR